MALYCPKCRDKGNYLIQEGSAVYLECGKGHTFSESQALGEDEV